MPIRRIDKTLTATTATVAGEDIAASAIPVKPHIQPGVLQPAVAGKLLDGSTSHSGNYGTAQADGHSYYYTDIKGSKPIKDPRIGAHFGSQRHKFKSLQLLEQETATHGTNTYSIDGREWCRVVGNPVVFNGDGGNCIQSNETGSVTPAFFVEIVGYFNDFNCISRTSASRVDDINVTVNGTTTNSGDTDKLGGRTTVNSPLRNRYVDMGSVINHGDSTVATNLGTTPKINTIKLEAINTGSEYWQFFGVELIAQDTTSTANKSKIQIPAQNVVSYGKKFSISAATPHYDPFNGFTSGNLAAVQALIDTSTSLGMSNWLSSSTYYRPFNGGRVVKWIASDGTIKTSVTMMPPNAQNINGTASNAHTLGATNDDPINFNTTAIDHSLSEVAKTWFAREFGNGNANGGSSGTYKDMTMLYGGTQDPAYVMDDGLTSISGNDLEFWGATSTTLAMEATSGDSCYTTFIGTGVSVISDSQSVRGTIALNLPYGTHILKQVRTANNHPDLTLNGVSITKSGFDTKGSFSEITFHQPKMPPIPEDACILADYMLMADFVVQTAGKDKISKGVRMQSHSRDYFVDGVSYTDFGLSLVPADVGPMGLVLSGGGMSSGDTATYRLPYFGTDFLVNHRDNRIGNLTEFLNSDVGTQASISTSGYDGLKKHTGNVLGLNGIQNQLTHSLNDNETFSWASYIVTPIHTSSHYQTFETPYLHELVGGDRNMEQNNLIVTPDGKSWDEVTRDTSYISPNFKANIHRDGGDYTNEAVWVWDVFRGKPQYSAGCVLKDFAPAYDRLICLVDGKYRFNFQGTERAAGDDAYWYFQITGNAQIGIVAKPDGTGTRKAAMPGEQTFEFKRGDWIKVIGYYVSGDDIRENTFTINKVS